MKYRIQYNNGYYLHLGFSPSGKIPYITTDKKDQNAVFTFNEALERLTELMQFIEKNEINMQVHIIPTE